VPGAVTGSQKTPGVLIYSGTVNANLLSFYTFPTTAPVTFDVYVANVGDITGDGRRDFALSSGNNRVFVLAAATPTLQLLNTITGPQTYKTLAAGKDVFGLGAGDLVTAMPAAWNGGTGRGLVEIQPLAESVWTGAGCSATVQPPRLTGTNRPIVNGSYGLRVDNSYTAPGSYTLFLVVDVAPPAAIPFGNCTLFVRIGQSAVTAATVSLTPGVPNTFSFPIAGVPAFGVVVWQAAVIDPNLNIDVTNGQVMRTGTL
jgi:hypothetical protein